MVKKVNNLNKALKNMGILDNIHSGVKSLNNNKFFAGLIMIILNIGSKYITIKFSKTQEAYLRNVLGRQALIFAVAFMATKDIYMSLVILFIFVILADYIFNDESKFCIIPQKYRQEMKDLLDKDGDGKVSEDEINDAIKVLKQAKKTTDYKSQRQNYTTFMNNLV